MKEVRDKYQDILYFWKDEIHEFDDIFSVKEAAYVDICELVERLRKAEADLVQYQTFLLDNELNLTPEFKNYTLNGLVE